MSHTSVIMAGYKADTLLFPVVQSVLQQEGLHELILIDRGESPDVFARLQQITLSNDKFKIISTAAATSFAAGANAGAKQASGDYLMMLSPEILLAPGTIAALHKQLVATPAALVVMPKIVMPDGSPEHLYPAGIFVPTGAVGACVHIKKSEFEKLGGFDERFSKAMANADLLARVSAAGGGSVRVLDTEVVRVGAGVKTSLATLTKAHLQLIDKHAGGEIAKKLALKTLLLFRFLTLKIQKQVSRSSRSQVMAMRRLLVLSGALSEQIPMPEIARKTVLVTGATSQIGLFAVKRLLAAGAAVLAVSREKPIPFSHKNLRWIQADLTDDSLDLQDYAVDLVVNVAQIWMLPPVLEKLADAGVKRIVAISSTSKFAKANSKNTYEKELVQKIVAVENTLERDCVARGIGLTILRPTLIYGAGLDANVTSLARIMKKLGFFPVYPPAFGRRQPVHADDLAWAALRCLTLDIAANKSYNVSGGEILSYREMLDRIKSTLGIKARIINSTLLPFVMNIAGFLSHKPALNGEIAHRMNEDLVFFHDDAKRDIGYNPRPFLSGGKSDFGE